MVLESKVSGYIKTHERLIITVIIALIIAFGYTKTLTFLADRAKGQFDKITAALTAQIEVNKKTDEAAKQTTAQYKALVDQLTAENTLLLSARSQRTVVTEKQKEVDRVLPPSALADRWNLLLSVDPVNVKPSSDGYQVSQEAAVDTVTRLEMVPQLQEDLAGADKIIANDAAQARSSNDVVVALQLQVSGRDVQISDQTAACKVEVATVKAEARKSKLKWFGAGFVVGLAARGAIKLFVGL